MRCQRASQHPWWSISVPWRAYKQNCLLEAQHGMLSYRQLPFFLAATGLRAPVRGALFILYIQEHAYILLAVRCPVIFSGINVQAKPKCSEVLT